MTQDGNLYEIENLGDVRRTVTFELQHIDFAKTHMLKNLKQILKTLTQTQRWL